VTWLGGIASVAIIVASNGAAAAAAAAAAGAGDGCAVVVVAVVISYTIEIVQCVTCVVMMWRGCRVVVALKWKVCGGAWWSYVR